MQIRQLRYFVAIARNGSFSRAASELHVAQPALSSQIATLEDELGVKLLVRHSRGVELTEAGKLLLERSGQVLELIDSIARDIAAAPGKYEGEIRIGLPTTTTAVLTEPLLEAISRSLPGITLHVVEGMTGHLEGWLAHDDIDVALLFAPSQTQQAKFKRVGFERLVLIGPRHKDMAGKTVRFAELSVLPIVHVTRAHQLRKLIDDMAVKLRSPLNIIAEIDSLAQIKHFVFSGKGYTILPRMAVTPDWVNGDIDFWPISDSSLKVDLVIATSPRFERQPFCRPFLKLFEDVIRDLIRDGRWHGAGLIEHNPKKWKPVHGQDHARLRS